MPSKGKGKRVYAQKCDGYYTHLRNKFAGNPEDE
jgi:hypothetical protein